MENDEGGPEETQQRRNGEERQTMIQNLRGDFDRICIDSGAGEGVCPVDAVPEYGPEAKGGKEVSNLNRHVEKLLKEAGLEDCKSLNAPGTKDVSVTSPLDDDHVPDVSPGTFRYLGEHRRAECSIEKK